MKKTLVFSTLLISFVLACGGDKKPAASEPKATEATEPAKTDPAAPADPNAPKPEEKKAGGW